MKTITKVVLAGGAVIAAAFLLGKAERRFNVKLTFNNNGMIATTDYPNITEKEVKTLAAQLKANQELAKTVVGMSITDLQTGQALIMDATKFVTTG